MEPTVEVRQPGLGSSAYCLSNQLSYKRSGKLQEIRYLSTPSLSPYSCRLNTSVDTIGLSPEPASWPLRPAYGGLDLDFHRFASDLIRYVSPRHPRESPDGLISFAGKPVTWERPRRSNYWCQITSWFSSHENDAIRVFLRPKKPYLPDFRITTSAKLFRCYPDMLSWFSRIVADPDGLILRRLDLPVDIQADKLELQRHLHTPRFSIPIGLHVEQEAGKYDNTFYLGSSQQRYLAIYTKAVGSGGQEIVRIEARFFGKKLDALGINRLGDLPWMLPSLEPFDQLCWLPETRFANVERARRRRSSGQAAYKTLQAKHAGAYARMRAQVAEASEEFRDRISRQWRADVCRFLCPDQNVAVHYAEAEHQDDPIEPVRDSIEIWSANDQPSCETSALRTEPCKIRRLLAIPILSRHRIQLRVLPTRPGSSICQVRKG